MSATLNGFGLRPAYSPNGYAPGTGYINGIASGYGTAILKYQPVTLNSSGVLVIAATNADFIGSFAGVSYVDSQGVPQFRDSWTASQTYNANMPMWAWVYGADDPDLVFEIQADGSVAQSVGGQVDFASGITNGNTSVGLSTCLASASSLSTSAQKQLRITAVAPVVGNAFGDAYTILRVKNARHQFVANKIAV